MERANEENEEEHAAREAAAEKLMEPIWNVHVYSIPELHSCTLALTEKLIANGWLDNRDAPCDHCVLDGVSLYSCYWCCFNICPECVDEFSNNQKAKTNNPVWIKEAQAAEAKILAKIDHVKSQELLQYQRKVEQLRRAALQKERQQGRLKRKREEVGRAEADKFPPSYNRKKSTKAAKVPPAKSKTCKDKRLW